jgi:hypothetical protein
MEKTQDLGGAIEDEYKDKQERLEKVRQWDKRLDAIEKATGLSRNRFCRRHHTKDKPLQPAMLSRYINEEHLPDWDVIKRWESALKKEEDKISKKGRKNGRSK